ncbi:MAG TPA: hypothetical protein VFT28_11195, partial [Gemmatimonadales bacterium]|nr:hypothetical protein [Gemmatimonadales bacterium]
MSQAFHQICDQTVQAALVEDQAFSDLLPRLMDEARRVPPRELSRAMPRMAQGIAESPPNLGGWLAVLAGAWVENGADPDPVGPAVVARTVEVAAAAVAFAGAWEESAGGKPPHMKEERPSQQVLDVVAPKLGDGCVTAMMSWFALPEFAMSVCTILSVSPAVRAAVPDRDLAFKAAKLTAPHWGQMDYVADLVRVLDDHPLLVLDRESRRGWMITIRGVGDNFQLHTLLGGGLVNRPDGVPGHDPDPSWISGFTDGEAGSEPVIGWWNLTDAHGDPIWNEGVPADIPEVNGTRVVVLDPQSYQRSWSPGRRFPL